MHPLGLVALAECWRSESRHRDSGRLAADQAIPDAPHPSRWAGVKSRIATLAGHIGAVRQRSATTAPLGTPATKGAPDLA